MRTDEILKMVISSPPGFEDRKSRIYQCVNFDYALVGLLVTSINPTWEMKEWIAQKTDGPVLVRYLLDGTAVIGVTLRRDAEYLCDNFSAEIVTCVLAQSRLFGPPAQELKSFDRNPGKNPIRERV